MEPPQLLVIWNELNSTTEKSVDVVCLGNPHFSLTECASLSALCKDRTKHPNVRIIVTLGRAVYEAAERAGSIATLDAFGLQFINDTCWCMIEEPIIPIESKVLMTNSGKYAYYGPGLVNRPMHFGSLTQCVEAACCGERIQSIPDWCQ